MAGPRRQHECYSTRDLRSRRHRRRHQRRRHSARRRRPGPVGAAGGKGRPCRAHFVVEHQADPRRPALSRALRVSPGGRIAVRARGAAQAGAAHHRAAAIRAAPRAAPAAGLDDPLRPFPVRPHRRPEDFALVVRRRPRRKQMGAGLRNSFRKGFVYSDARVDDARLVVLNAIGARELGADVRVRTRLEAARRENGLWRATLIDGAGRRADVLARALVNAAGPWVKELLDQLSPGSIRAQVRHVKGSHIVVPRVHPESHAYILQNSDKRIVFIIPFQQEFSLIGTTDVPVDDYDTPHIAVDEIDYLCSIANAYLARGIAVADIVWTYSGVRPLYDDGADDPSAITRDYVLQLDAADGRAPLLSVFGGKITTYRKLAEHALGQLRS